MNKQSYFYVIMPLDSDNKSSEKVDVIRDSAHEHEFTTHFPNYKKDLPDFDLQSTIEDFQNALFVLADLTLERPSCYYELGIAEAIGATVYLVAAEGTDIHQTSHRTGIYFYRNLEHLREVISNILTREKISKKATL